MACKEAGTTEQSYYRWRKEYGGLNVDQAKRLKQLEDENGRLKKLVADLSLEKQVLSDHGVGNHPYTSSNEISRSPHFSILLKPPRHVILVGSSQARGCLS